MFDKLVVSEPAKADQPSRRSYFMVSSVVVGILFVTAVVISIFAADFSVGSPGLDLARLIPPHEMAAAKPEPRPSQPLAADNTSRPPSRTSNVLNIIENPIPPNFTSTVRSNAVARPLGDFTVGRLDSEPADTAGAGRGTVTAGGDSPSGLQQALGAVPNDGATPPAVKNSERTAVRRVSRGVVNGIARSLPKPEYSATARAVNAQGKVAVQVTISATGNVISAQAVSGPVLLRPAAENAARQAKFTPTTLSEVPVEVTGVIVYNFVR